MYVQVESEHSGRMQIGAISSSGSVTFTPCQQGSSSWPEELVSFLLVSRHQFAATGLSTCLIDVQTHCLQRLYFFRFPKSKGNIKIVSGALLRDVPVACRREVLR